MLLLLVLTQPAALGQNSSQRIEEQKEAIKQLERQIAEREKEINSLKQDRSSEERRARALARQIEDRNDLLEASMAEERTIVKEVEGLDSEVNNLHASLLLSKRRYAEMVREAYRNYHQNNYLTYIFSAKSFSDVARRIANLREVAALRERQIERIDSLEQMVISQLEVLALRKMSLDSVQSSVTSQRERLERDARAAKASINKLSKREKEALRRKQQEEQELDRAIAELRKLTKGNKEGAGFSTSTSNLNLPVIGGRVKKYKGNMAEISGEYGAKVITIYDGKIVDVKRNRITNKYDVYVAHGEYITSYANLQSVVVEKNQVVKRNQQLGVIGSSVDISTMQNSYKIVFGIYPPDPKKKMLASDCFKKK
ncbi:MAG: peptidoglycan DD-metalloendopeptidase family protein [Alistipes sp.]|nr:peptidoglycan DD-metalloendopeptidase family protein [Alistipes sp.]